MSLRRVVKSFTFIYTDERCVLVEVSAVHKMIFGSYCVSMGGSDQKITAVAQG